MPESTSEKEMYSVDHLVEHHLKQMERLSRQQEKAARKREKQQVKLEEAFARFREEIANTLPGCNGETGNSHQQPVSVVKKSGFLNTLRAFLF